jgi:hypothetical protein
MVEGANCNVCGAVGDALFCCYMPDGICRKNRPRLLATNITCLAALSFVHQQLRNRVAM